MFGVHQLVAMTFDSNYTPDCHVHHLDENKSNNKAYNLECMSKSDHARLHADITPLSNYLKENGPYNKGMKMSDEFREKCRQSALRRAKENRSSKYNGNQFVDAYGNRKYISEEKRMNSEKNVDKVLFVEKSRKETKRTNY